MSEGEFLITVVCIVASLFAQLTLWYRVAARPALVPAGPGAVLIAFAPAMVGGVTLLALGQWASFDVRDDVGYLTMYSAAGVAWVAAVAQALHHTRLSWIDDVLERDNPAAGVAAVGLLIGATACYVGGNVGDGPGWWVVLFASGTGTLLWLLALEVLQRATDVFEKVTLDLDLGAGLRLAGFAAATGIVAGRGAAGDWYSFERMVVEFQVAWPVLPLLVAGAAVERLLGRAPFGRGRLALSALIALGYLLVAWLAIDASPALTENPLYGATR